MNLKQENAEKAIVIEKLIVELKKVSQKIIIKIIDAALKPISQRFFVCSLEFCSLTRKFLMFFSIKFLKQPAQFF